MRLGRLIVFAALAAACLLAYRPWTDRAAVPERYAVVIAVGWHGLLSDQTVADVVWSPTANELTVPAALQPGPGERLLWLGAGGDGAPAWRWLPAGRQQLADGITFVGLSEHGHLQLKTGDDVISVAAGESWVAPGPGEERLELYYAGAFGHLAVAP